MLFVYSYYNVFGTIYALFRCYTAVSRKVVQLISMKACAKVPKGIMDIVVCTACLIQTSSNVMAGRLPERPILGFYEHVQNVSHITFRQCRVCTLVLVNLS